MQKDNSAHRFKTLSEADMAEGAAVLVRVDFNVPVEQGQVQDDFRIAKALPTIEYLKGRGCKIILISHIENKEGSSLGPVSDLLSRSLSHTFVPTLEVDEVRQAVESLEPGGVVLLENLRSNPGEKENDEQFARFLASLADIYVNDAFSASHREHASIIGVSRFLPSFAGLLLENEIQRLSEIFKDPLRPFLFILGGAKFGTKLPLIEKFLNRADSVFVGGALANDLFKARGLEVGQSLLSEGVDLSGIAEHESLSIPSDVVAEMPDGSSLEKPADSVAQDERIVDAGSESVADIVETARGAKLIVWNGPLGDYEHGYSKATEELARAFAELNDVEVLIGGGDTLAVIGDLGLRDAYSFVSTGGGAMLEFLSRETLPGIEALGIKQD